MTEYALVGPNGEVKAFGMDTNIDPKVQTKPGWFWLEVERVRASFDPSTQKVENPDPVVIDGKLVYTQTVRAKTQAELDQEAADFAASVEGRLKALEDQVFARTTSR